MAKAKKKATAKKPASPKKVVLKKFTKKSATKGSPASAAQNNQLGSPVTLKEAKALAQAQAPVSAAASAVAPAQQAATHLSVAEERQRLDNQIIEENERRIREYKATMAIMKARGVKGLAAQSQSAGANPPGAVPAATVAGAAGTPLQIFAEGDSWFNYPVPFFGGGIIPRLESRLGVPILSLAKAGDEVRNMLGVEEREILAEQLRDGSPAGGKWDVLLFSGGGNDIVGNPMALWVKDFNGAVPATNLISKARFDAALELVRAGYEDLITLRDTLSPTTHLVFHGYDFAIPDGRGICGNGPWMKPTFDLRGFPNRPPAVEVVKAMLQQFATILNSLAATHNDVTFINTQGTLAPVPASWHNELHPSKAGFNKVADVFHTSLKNLFPGRVL